MYVYMCYTKTGRHDIAEICWKWR